MKPPPKLQPKSKQFYIGFYRHTLNTDFSNVSRFLDRVRFQLIAGDVSETGVVSSWSFDGAYLWMSARFESKTIPRANEFHVNVLLHESGNANGLRSLGEITFKNPIPKDQRE